MGGCSFTGAAWAHWCSGLVSSLHPGPTARVWDGASDHSTLAGAAVATDLSQVLPLCVHCSAGVKLAGRPKLKDLGQCVLITDHLLGLHGRLSQVLPVCVAGAEFRAGLKLAASHDLKGLGRCVWITCWRCMGA